MPYFDPYGKNLSWHIPQSHIQIGGKIVDNLTRRPIESRDIMSPCKS
jgi:hypothetical protein